MSVALALLCLAQSDSIEMLVKAAASKDERAERKLLEMGSTAIRPLIAERAKYEGAERNSLDDLLFRLKQAYLYGEVQTQPRAA